MDGLVSLLIVGGLLYWFWWRPRHPNKTKKIDALDKQQQEIYNWYCKYKEELINKDIPKWIKEEEDFQKQYPESKTKPFQKPRIKEEQDDYDRVKKVRELFLRAFTRHKRNQDLLIEILEEWIVFISYEARQRGYGGSLFPWLGLPDDEFKLMNIQKEEAESKLKKLLK